VAIHHLAYLLNLSGTRFFPIPSIDFYFVNKWRITILLILWIWM